MQISDSIEITKPKNAVWSVITDIENSSNWISNIINIEVMNKPKNALTGLKWKETRKFCGKEASEIMWVTESSENDYYCTRAESHGSVYISHISLKGTNDVTTLTMSFSAAPQTMMAKLLSTIMNRFISKSLLKEIRNDLIDIKNHVEEH